MTYLINNNSNVTKRVEFAENSDSQSTLRANGLGLSLIKSYEELERPELPIDAVSSQLVEILAKNDTSIIIGETGSGKSTQVPQLCVKAGLHEMGKIGITQPRRVAAFALANRVAEEMETQVGDKVGYKFRFNNETSEETNVVFLTDGILLREAIFDSFLSSYTTIIIDEAHERSLHTDILLYLLRMIQKQRRENSDMNPLKLVIMSATMNSEKISAYFDNAPIYYIEGRTYPVELFYANSLTIKDDDDYVYNAVSVVLDLHESEPIDHDFLVFLTGQEDIEKAQKMVKDDQKNATTRKILPLGLYASLSTQMQARAFSKAPQGTRKVIFATNIAETSLTIPGIRIVIDTGRVKQKLYSSQEYEKMDEMPTPEILRSNLCGVLLELSSIGLKSPSTIKLLDQPNKENIEAALDMLEKINAITVKKKLVKNVAKSFVELTSLGKKLSDFPVDPIFARILIAAEKLNCLEEALTVVAFISSEDVFLPLPSSLKEEEKYTRKFDTNEGDHIKFLNIFRAYKSAKNSLKHQELKEWCVSNCINERRLQNVIKARKQLRDTCINKKYNVGSCGLNTSLLRQAIAHGLFMNACEYDPVSKSFKLISSPGIKVKIHPSSCLAMHRPTTIVFTELVRTKDLFARTVSLVDAEWIKKALDPQNGLLS
uniref:RNA helicase n=1 Tax=Acrobeloides nanus TaxID=290746 RepID=A0A914D2Y9_9BILA